MLMIQAIANSTTTRQDHLSFSAGQYFYVLSAYPDKRLYFVSTSARIPFSRSATAGYVPSSLFVIVGDTVPPSKSKRNETEGRIQENKNREQVRNGTTVHQSSLDSETFGGAGPVRQSQVQVRKIPESIETKTFELGNSKTPLDLSDSKSSKGGGQMSSSLKNLTATAKSLLELTASGSQSKLDEVQSVVKETTKPLEASVPAINLTASRILTYRRRKHSLEESHRGPVEYKISCTMSNGEKYLITRSYTDFYSMQIGISSFTNYYGYPNPPPLLPEPLEPYEEQTNAKQRGRDLNVYLDDIVHLNEFLLSKNRSLPLLPFFTPDITQQPVPDRDGSAANSEIPYINDNNESSTTRRGSADSGFASRSSSRKNSFANDLQEGRLPPVIQEVEPQDEEDGYSPSVVQFEDSTTVVTENYGITGRFLRKLEQLASRPFRQPEQTQKMDLNHYQGRRTSENETWYR